MTPVLTCVEKIQRLLPHQTQRGKGQGSHCPERVEINSKYLESRAGKVLQSDSHSLHSLADGRLWKAVHQKIAAGSWAVCTP